MAKASAAPEQDEGREERGPVDEALAGLDLEAIADELAAAEGFVGARVERALAPYRGMFAPEVLDELADDLECLLLTHPVASQMLARVRPRAQRLTSGEGDIVDLDLPEGPALDVQKDGTR